MRIRAVAGLVAFTAASIVSALRQTGHGWASIQVSGLAAPDARDPWIMITGFLVPDGCLVFFGGATSRSIRAGVLAIAAALPSLP